MLKIIRHGFFNARKSSQKMKINSFKYLQHNSLMHLWKYSKKRLKNVVWHFMLLCFSVFPVLNICPLVLYHFSSTTNGRDDGGSLCHFYGIFQPCFNWSVAESSTKTCRKWYAWFINSILHKTNANSLYANMIEPFTEIITCTALLP